MNIIRKQKIGLTMFNFDGYNTETAEFSNMSTFSQRDINSMINMVVTRYHANIREQVPIIYELANDLFSRCGDKYPELAKLVESLFLFFDDLLFQLRKEEQLIFPSIIELAGRKDHRHDKSGILTEQLMEMKKEYRAVVDHLPFLRQLMNDYKTSEDSCESHVRLCCKMKAFNREFIQHVNLKMNILIPRVVQINDP